MAPRKDLPLTLEVEVDHGRRVEFEVPFPDGTELTVVVLRRETSLQSDLLQASESSVDFWDNEFDDEDWNDA